ncbi:11451_t:CDS:2, partial [Racocetra persica]
FQINSEAIQDEIEDTNDIVEIPIENSHNLSSKKQSHNEDASNALVDDKIRKHILDQDKITEYILDQDKITELNLRSKLMMIHQDGQNVKFAMEIKGNCVNIVVVLYVNGKETEVTSSCVMVLVEKNFIPND